MARHIIQTDKAARPRAPYSQAVGFNDLIFTAGQVALDPVSQQAVPGGIQEQTRQVLENLKAVLEAGDASLGSVLKTSCFLADINDFAALNDVYREYFPTDPPARSTFQVVLVPPWLVEVEAVAAKE